MIGLKDPGRHLLGVNSLCAGPAPLPGPGLGLATLLAPPELGVYRCAWVTTLRLKRAEAAFRVGVKAAGCILGDRLDWA